MLLITASCSLELSCRELLAEKSIVNVLLPFCKSDCFGIRLGAKSSLSSLSYLLSEQHLKLICIDEHESAALNNSLKEFAEVGSYRKLLRTSLSHYHFSAIDMFLLLNALVGNPFNSEFIQSTSMLSVLHHFVVSGSEVEKSAVTELLWRLCCNQDAHSRVLSEVPKIKGHIPREVFSNREVLHFSHGQPVQLLATSPEYLTGVLKLPCLVLLVS